MIVAAAIVYDDVIWTLPRPARHHHIIWAHKEVTGEGGSGQQGFVDEAGHFWDRKHARRIAIDCGQNPKQSGGASLLFSEDLW